MWGLLVLIVVAPAAFYGFQAVVRQPTPSGSSIPTTVHITTPSAQPLGPTPSVTLAPPIPSPRELDAMAFDATRNEIVMYGGSGFGAGQQTDSRSTWIFDAGGWHLRHPVTSPDVVAGSMTQDPVTGSVVLVGAPPARNHPLETWTWDGTTWTRRGELAVATQDLIGMGAIFGLGQLVMVTTPTTGASTTDDTWLWVGSMWRLQAPPIALPVEGSTPVLSSDPAHRRVVAVFTGTANSRAETWAWNGATWSQLAANEVEPFDPITAAMAPDPRSGDVVMYIGGGDARSGSTWALSGSTWRQVNGVAPAVDTDYHGAWLLADTDIGRVLMIGNAGGPTR